MAAFVVLPATDASSISSSDGFGSIGPSSASRGVHASHHRNFGLLEHDAPETSQERSQARALSVEDIAALRGAARTGGVFAFRADFADTAVAKGARSMTTDASGAATVLRWAATACMIVAAVCFVLFLWTLAARGWRSSIGSGSTPNEALVPSPTASTTLTTTTSKKALLIGINYVNTTNELAGCIDDIRNTERVLRSNGFDEIVVLSDVDETKPTRANIEAALKTAAAATKAGDVLFFHYSGHGGRTIAPSSVSEPDGKNSTIFPLDYSKAGQIPGYRLRELLFDAVPEGATVVALVDACHSGSIGELRYTYSDASFRAIAMRGLLGGFASHGGDGGLSAQEMHDLGLEDTAELSPHAVAHLAAHALHKRARHGAKSPIVGLAPRIDEQNDGSANTPSDARGRSRVRHVAAIVTSVVSAAPLASATSDSASLHASPTVLSLPSVRAVLQEQPAETKSRAAAGENVCADVEVHATEEAHAETQMEAPAAAIGTGASPGVVGAVGVSGKRPPPALRLDSLASAPVTEAEAQVPQDDRHHRTSHHSHSHSPPAYTRYHKPHLTHKDHVEARALGFREFLRTQHEWRSRDVIPVEISQHTPTRALVVVFSGCKNEETSADTQFDSEPSGAFTYAFLCALCGSFKSTHVMDISLRDFLKTARGTLASSGYTQTPMISCGKRIAIDEISIRQLLKL